MRITLAAFAALILVAATGYSAEIKSTTRLTVTSGGLAQPIEITDAKALAISNVYAGTFIGSPATEPNERLARYTVTFDIQTLQGIKSPAYTVEYCIDPQTGEGFIHLPGTGEAHRRNISTILRQGHDGKWFSASTEWNAVMKERIRPRLIR